MSTTNEVMNIVSEWLEDMKYNGPELDLNELIQAEFGESLYWISQHAKGRIQTAFIKRELHQLRETADVKLSNPRRKELGLNLFESAARENLKLQKDDEGISSELDQVLGEFEKEGRTKAMGNESLLNARTLLSRLSDASLDYHDSNERITALAKLIEDWKIAFEKNEGESTTPSDNCLIQSLRRPTLPHNYITSRASLSSLEETIKSQLELSEHLRELTSRHTRIPPPPIQIFKSTLSSLRQHHQKLKLIPASTPIPYSSSDRRQELIESILRSRERRNALELLLTVEPEEDTSSEVLRVAKESIEEVTKTTQSLLQFRADLLLRISSLKKDSQQSLRSIQDQIADHKSNSLSSVDSNITSILSTYATESLKQPVFTNSCVQQNDTNLINEITRALKTVHLLDTQPKLHESISEIEVAKFCDSLAESRFAIENLGSSLETNLAVEIPKKKFEELVNLRHQFIEGNLLPHTKMKDGKTLLEKYKKLERESNRKQIL